VFALFTPTLVTASSIIMRTSLHVAMFLLAALCISSTDRAFAQATNGQTEAITASGPIDSLTHVISFTSGNVRKAPPVQHQIFVDPYRIIFSYHLGYLHALTSRWVVGGSIRSGSGITSQPDAKGFGLTVEGHYYVSSTPMRGFALQGSLGFDHVVETLDDDSETSAVYLTPGISLGYHSMVWGFLSVSLEVGGDYHFEKTRQTVALIGFTSTGEGIVPSVRWTLGYDW
jgi:hypothetical protein